MYDKEIWTQDLLFMCIYDTNWTKLMLTLLNKLW